jgi:endonuclease/exonuclease/phosphatase family metal-dependent hydrolase
MSMKKSIRILMYCVSFLILILAGFLFTAVITDYNPKEKTLVFESANAQKLIDTLEFDILLWNIGYCGLDKSMDFFYDGGKHVRPAKENSINNLTAILNFLKSQDSLKFVLLQEVDKNSKRSYRINQFEKIQKALPKFNAFFGKNYDVFFVPEPLTKPYGKVLSGLVSLSRFQPSNVARYSLPGKYAFPKGLFMLDRCFLAERFPLENGKELIIINTHNEAYDNGSHRKKQMQYLHDFIIKEYQSGNYIVAGGDWNQCPPEIQNKIEHYVFDNDSFSVIDKNLFPAEWKWIFKNDVPTNRRLIKPYDQKTSPVTVIDFFLISPNVENLDIENINLGFEHSDHNPVKAKFRLKKAL